MKKCALTFVAGLALVGISLGVTSCTQAPAPVAAAPAADTPAPAPAPAPPVVVEERRPVVVEENHPRPSVDINVRKRDDGDHTSVDIHARP
jgi:hypothetical protein